MRASKCPGLTTTFCARWIDIKEELPDANDYSQILVIPRDSTDVELLTWNVTTYVDSDCDLGNWYLLHEGEYTVNVEFKYWMPAPTVRTPQHNCESMLAVKYRKLKDAYKALRRGDYDIEFICSDTDEESCE
jgi:hypothetical protein